MLDDIASVSSITPNTPTIVSKEVLHIWIGERLDSLKGLDFSEFLCRNNLYVDKDQLAVKDLYTRYGGTRLKISVTTTILNAATNYETDLYFIGFKPHGTMNDEVYDNRRNTRSSASLATANVNRADKTYRDNPIYQLVIDAKGSYVNTALPADQTGKTSSYRQILNF